MRLAFALGFAATACSNSASVQFELENLTAFDKLPNVDGSSTPEVLGIKLVAVYIGSRLGPTSDNVGSVGRLWTNPVCDPDLYQCQIASVPGPYRVTDYFDLARSSSAVNAELNAAPEPVPPDTYTYVRVDFAGAHAPDDVPNLLFGNAGDLHEVRYRTHTLTVPIEPPLVLAAGDSFRVSLRYRYKGSYYPASESSLANPPAGVDQGSWYCAGNFGPCLAFSDITATAVRVGAADAGRVDAGPVDAGSVDASH